MYKHKDVIAVGAKSGNIAAHQSLNDGRFLRQKVSPINKGHILSGASVVLCAGEGGGMAASAIALTSWSVEYYQTMAAAEQARLEVAKGLDNFFSQAVLWKRFKTVTDDTEKFIHALNQVESLPASVLLAPGAEKIPDSLRDLFRTMCDVLQRSEAEGLHKAFFLRRYIVRLGELSQEVSGFADRFEDAQKKLRSRVPPEEAAQYREAFLAYENCGPQPEHATDDDVKRELLHF